MKEFFELKQAAKVIMNDMIKFDIGFDRAWSNYNNEWFNNTLMEPEKEQTKQFILDVLNRWH